MARDESTRAASRNPALNVELDLFSDKDAKLKILRFKIKQYETELNNMHALLEKLEKDES